MAKLVFSYSHVDEELRNELEKHLSPLKRMGKIDAWHDRRIVPGEEFEGQIDKNFLEADIILLLVSSDFIDSDYCFQVEMESALQRHDRGEAIVIPVIPGLVPGISFHSENSWLLLKMVGQLFSFLVTMKVLFRSSTLFQER